MTQNADAEKIAQLLQGLQIPPRPEVMVAVQQEQQQASPDIRRIADLISQDVSISGAVLKTVNSPLFGLSRKVTSINQAAVLLGFKYVSSIVSSVSVRSAIKNAGQLNIELFWETAMEKAIVCAGLARHLKLGEPDDCYTLGLFQDIGIPLLLQKFPQYLKVLAFAHGQNKHSLANVEQHYFQINHCDTGQFVCQSWYLPDHISTVIKHHHDWALITDKDALEAFEHADLLLLLKLAEHISNPMQTLGISKQDHEWEIIGRPLLDYAGISEPDFLDLAEQMREQVLDEEVSGTHV